MSMSTATTVSDLETARKNAEVHIRIVLDADDDDQIAALANQLQEGFEGAVRTITLVGSNQQDVDGHYRHSPDISGLLTAVGTLPSVVHVKLENISPDGWTIPASLLTCLFQQMAHRLETLELTALQVEGTVEEMGDLEAAAAGLVCLRSCCFLNNFILWLGKCMHPLDGLLKALSQLPLLLGVYLDIDYFNDSNGHAKQLRQCTQALDCLLNSPNIHELILSKFAPDHPALNQIGEAIQATTSLHNLTLYFQLPQVEAWKHLPSITTCLQCLPAALLVNTRLQELKLHFGNDGYCPKLDTFLVQMAQALASNAGSALVELEVVAPCTFGAAVEEAFVSTLRTNYTLQKMECFTTSDDSSKYISLDAGHRTEMELYLRLNEQGRKRLMGSYTRNTWTDALANHAHDLDALFYYLQINPWLMTNAHERPKKNTPVIRRKRGRCNDIMELSTSSRQALQLEIHRLKEENAALKANQQKRRRFLIDATAIVANVTLLLVGATTFNRTKV
jgi:hypothetical protein